MKLLLTHYLTIFVLTFFAFPLYAQHKGYIPTKADSVKKIIPPQVYGKQNSTKIPTTNVVIDTIIKVIENDPITQKEDEQKLQAEKLKKEQEEKNRLDRQLEKEKADAERIAKEKADAKKAKHEKKNHLPGQNNEPIVERNSNHLLSTKTINFSGNWTLEKCIDFARDNNLQISELELNERLNRLIWQQSKNAALPTVNGDVNIAESYGRSIDPTSNQYVTKGFLYNTLGLSSQTLLFGWYQKKHQIEQNRLSILSANEQYNQLKDDISLNVATGFLRILLARDQVKINEAQLKLDNEQFVQTTKFVNAGKLPELNLVQMLSQVSTDSSNLISAQYDERIALLQLRALMNFNFEQNFDIQSPNIDNINIAELLNIPSPEAMYNTAMKNQHRMKYNEIKLLSANKTLDIAKSTQYPQLSLFANLGTNFSSNVKQITGQTYNGETPIGNVNLGGTSYLLTTPTYNYSTQIKPLFTQYGNNIRANIGLDLSIPIFNGYAAKTNIQKAKIGLVSQQIAFDSDKQKLKQDIYTAYEQARASSQKYIAAKRAQESAKRALDFAVKRYQIGMLNTFEYTQILNSFYTASTSVLSSKYDLLFKLKILDYYMGNPLKL